MTASPDSTWKHPGGKLCELGPDALSDSELLAILVSSGIKGRSAEAIAGDILQQFGCLAGLANQPLERLLSIKGLGDVKILRIATALELARRAASEIVRGREEKAQQTS